MLPRRHRITKTEFNALIRPDFQIHGPSLRIAVKKKEKPVIQASVVVSKKVAKKAHDRNDLSRKLYKMIAEKKTLLVLPAMVALFTKPGIEKLSQTGLKNETLDLLEQVRKKLS